MSAVQALVDADADLETVDEVRALCCNPVAHLCEVSLCGYVADPRDATRMVRGSPTSASRVTWTDGSVRYVPDCIPFYMPTPCCAP
ncbi:MAG: hypothetical protein H5U40_09910 [Polyangiaceae bacterium]|nr:hypothetical protein [Polyangiaceae bacterium]